MKAWRLTPIQINVNMWSRCSKWQTVIDTCFNDDREYRDLGLCEIDNMPKERLSSINQSLWLQVALKCLNPIKVNTITEVLQPHSYTLSSTTHFLPVAVDPAIPWKDINDITKLRQRPRIWLIGCSSTKPSPFALGWHYPLKSLLITCDESLM